MKIALPMLCAAMDLTGVAPFNPFAFTLEPGAYKGKITDVDSHYKEGKSTKLVVTLESGAMADIYIGNEPGEKGGNAKKWVQALCSIAPDVEKFLALVKSGFKFDPATQAKETFVGKSTYVLVTAVPGTNKDPQTGADRPNLPDKEFITKAQFDAYVAAHPAGSKPAPAAAPNGANGTLSNGTPTPTAAAPAADPLKALFG